MPRNLAIVGGGRVGRALGRRLREEGWKIGAVTARSKASARRATRFIGGGKAHGSLSRQVLASPVILIATPDDAIPGVASELARIGAEELEGKIVLHTSGALDSTVLDPVKAHGAFTASLHPLQTFSGIGVPPFEGRVFTIEGAPAAVRVARQIARSLGGAPMQIAPGEKALYHAAASMAAGHALALQEAATRLLMSTGMNRREAVRALLPLTRQVLENFERLGPHAAWTGPLSRNDYGIVAAHFTAMQDMPAEFAGAYEALNQLIARVLSADPGGMLGELEIVSAVRKTKVKASGSQV
jgi:predicted short-subunit dehydrogenase-like oxidoreductase (DUF2520 family)